MINMRKFIPAPIISVLSDILPERETHASIDSLFMYADAPGDPPEGSKPVKVQEWLRRTNKDDSVDPLKILGRLIEGYMEANCDPDEYLGEANRDYKAKIEQALARCGLRYVKGGIVSLGGTIPSRSLEKTIKDRDYISIDDEFDRAVRNVEFKPREAVSAASNILESICKIYIETEGLGMPKKQDLQPVWNVVRKDLGFDPASIGDRDLKEILSGLFAIVSGIGALRTHTSSAHGAGKKRYRLEPRHARLAIHSAHTVATFILESWDKKKNS